jgi:hypothetical protein
MLKLTTPRAILFGFLLTAVAIASIPYSMSKIQLAESQVAGMDWSDLALDLDFVMAVENIVERCDVDGDVIDC